MLKQDGVLLHRRLQQDLIAAHESFTSSAASHCRAKPACSHGDTLKTVVYKNYIPLCTVIAVGIGIYMFFNRSVYAAQVQASILLRCKASCNLHLRCNLLCNLLYNLHLWCNLHLHLQFKQG